MMTTSRPAESHPSYLALDRAGLGKVPPNLAEHLENCTECRDYVARLAEPPPASGLVRIQQQVSARRYSGLRRLFIVAPAIAAAAGTLLYIGLLRPQPDLPAGPQAAPRYVGTKGFTSVWIYVKHGTNTELWDGRRPLFAGDRLRIKLDPGRFRRVAVYSVKGPEAPALLYAGGVTPGESVTLPDAWEIDGEPGDERLVVAFSNEAIEPTWPDWLRGKAPPGVSLMPFVLPKSTRPDPDGGSVTP